MLDFPKKHNTSGGVCIFKTKDGLHLYASACVEIPFLTTEHFDLIDLHECTSFTKPAFPSPKQGHSNMTVGKYIQSKKLLAAICQLVEASNKYYFVEMSSAGGSSQWGHIIFKKKKLCQQMLALRHRGLEDELWHSWGKCVSEGKSQKESDNTEVCMGKQWEPPGQ